MSTDFKPTARSRAKRLHKRAHYDRATIYSIIDAAVLAHVGYVIDGQPFVTPTNCWRDGDRVLWHGSMASRMLKTVRERVPVCVTITHLDGLVMARSAFHHSVNYRSVMLFGRAEMVSDKEEKERALEAFVERIAPGRWATLRPMTAKELKATMVVSMQIEEASAKVRTGPPVDDEEDYALPIWAGVVPLKLAAGRPIDDPRLAPGTPVPANLLHYDIEGYANSAERAAAAD